MKNIPLIHPPLMEDGLGKREDVEEKSYFIPLYLMEDGTGKMEDVEEKPYFIPSVFTSKL